MRESTTKAERIPVAILGATGTVGQRFLTLLDGHPWFDVVSLVASPRSAGKRYADAVKWRLAGDVPAAFRDIVVQSAEDAPHPRVRAALSSLGEGAASETETRYAEAGVYVVSNASAHRMDEDVPLVVPEINADHLALVASQTFPNGGAIVCNPNCSTIGITLALAPLQAQFGVDSISVTTLQAASGAGYPGVSALDLIDNVVPFIPSEEEKLVSEPNKIFGSLGDGAIEPANISVSAQCCRVSVIDGHTASLSIGLAAADVTRDQILAAWESFQGTGPGFDGVGDRRPPSLPERPIRYRPEEDRPQPRLDRDAEAGMGVTVGRLRPCPILGWRFVALSHNTIRGAAGGALLVLELAVARGDVGSRETR